MLGGRYFPAATAVLFVLGTGLTESMPVTATTLEPGARAVDQAVPAARPPAQLKPTVVIDAGHGGVDPGAVSYATEKDVTLDVSLKLSSVLRARGIAVVMTRTTDWAWQRDGSYEEKVRDLQQRAGMARTRYNLFVSMHVNSAASAAANGIETWVFGVPLGPETLAQAERENGGGSVGRIVTAEARRVAGDIKGNVLAEANLRYSRDLAAALLDEMLAATGARSRGIKQSSFAVIRNARIPAVLVELGFASSPTEGRKLATSAYRQRLAQGIADGIVRFLK